MTTEPKPRSSTDWLNEELDLHALSQSTVWKDYLAHVEKARARQVLYEASIPQDRDEAIRQV